MNLLLLSVTLLALFCGPLLYVAARRRLGLLSFLDGFVLVTISGLVLLEVLPETLESGGLWALLFLALGALGPTLLENQLHHARRAHLGTLLFSIGGLIMHSVGDGTALAPQPGGGEIHLALALAIAVHSIPVGLAVWWLLYPVFGFALPALAIGGMAGGTLLGYAFSDALGGWLGATVWAWLQALVAGSILHVIFGRPHLDDFSSERRSKPPFEGLGNLLAVAALVLLETLHPAAHTDHAEHAAHAGHEHHAVLHPLLDLLLAIAPALLAATLAGIALAAWAAGRGGDGGAWGLLIGEDAESRYRRRLFDGAPASTNLLQLIAMPALSLIGLAVSLALLGPALTLARLVAVPAIALLVAVLLARLFPHRPQPLFRFDAPVIADELCEVHTHGPATAPMPARAPLRQSLPTNPASRHWLWPFEAQLPWLVCGLLIGAVGLPYLEHSLWSTLPPPAQLLLATATGALLGASAAGAAPVALMLLALGSPAGVALALLIASAAGLPRRLWLLRKLHGRRHATLYAALLLVGAFGAGWLLDAGLSLPVMATPSASGIVPALSLGALGLMAAVSLLRRGGRELFAPLFKTYPTS